MPLGLLSVLDVSRKHVPAATDGISTPLERRIGGTLDVWVLLGGEKEEEHDASPEAAAAPTAAPRRRVKRNAMVIIIIVRGARLDVELV